MPLKGHQSICEPRQKIIVSKDKRESRRHIANNVNNNLVSHYQIDGVVIISEKKCDFLLINEESMIAYLIELKGKNISDAIDQLENTERVLKSELSIYKLKYRIITNGTSTHNLTSLKYKKFIEKRPGRDTVKPKTWIFEEDI